MSNDNILSITPRACEHLLSMLLAQENKTLFHLTVKTTGCNGYMYVPTLLAEHMESDVLVAINIPFPVYVSVDAIEIIRGTVIDFETKSFGMKQLTFSNPNAAGICGCGESFNLKKDDV